MGRTNRFAGGRSWAIASTAYSRGKGHGFWTASDRWSCWFSQRNNLLGQANALCLLGRVTIDDSDLINVRIGPLCGLKSDISRGPRSADIVAKVRNCPALIFLL